MIPTDVAGRYATWIQRRRWSVIGVSISFAVTALFIALRLTVFADFSYLLPQSVRSVQDLRAIEKRARVIGTALVAVKSSDPVARGRAAVLLRDRIAGLGPKLVASVTFDRQAERDYAWSHRWLFVDLVELRKARDALADEIERAKLRANPLYVMIDDEPPAGPSAADELRGRLHDAETKRDSSAELVSADGSLQMMIVRTGFSSGDVDDDHVLLDRLDEVIDGVRAEVPGVAVGLAGDVVVTVVEHDAILNGMLIATAVTLTLVLAAMFWFFRSALAVGALSWSLAVGTVATFAFAKLALGYLNVATAFLSSIVIGNGINVGILVTSRYLEELRAGRDGAEALAGAIRNTIAGTLAAALTAAVAYASLVLTVFRGFRHFGIIGGVGILLCWAAAYLVLPAALAVGRQLGMHPRGEAPIGRWLARLLPNNLTAVAIVTFALTLVAGVIAARFLAGDPFENNFRNLRSRSAKIEEEQRWMGEVDRAFGHGIDAAFVIAVERRDAVLPIKARLRAADAGKRDADKLFARLASLDDLLPDEQPAKLAVLAEIRTLLSSKDVDALADADRAEAQKLRPPDDLRELGDADIPEALAWPFIEADGSRGKLILATAGPGFEVWDAHDTVRFAGAVRAIDLPRDVHLGGASFVFADVLEAVLVDGPRATLASILGATLIVLLVVGWNRHGLVTIVCGISGTALMLGIAAVAGLKVNFLDFVALPITIGIGIEYAVNIATRERQEGPGRGREAVAKTGGAVLLCSYTTIVGYGSLLLSQNLGIKSFGLAAMLGEITCIAVALVLAPALLWATARRA